MSELPKGWMLSNLGELVDYGTTVKVVPANISNDEWVLELEDIEKDTSRIIQRISFSDRKSKSAKNRFSANDVLYGKLRPNLNKVLIAMEGGVCTTEIVPLRCPADILLPHYLFYALKRSDFLDYVAHVSHGIDMPRLGTEAGRAAEVPLAPLPEQRRIVAKIDSLTGKSRRARDHLDNIPRLVEQYKQAVLAAAFRGELTREWRAKNKNNTGKREAENSIPNGPSMARARVRKTAALTPDQIVGMWDGPTGWRWSQVGDCAFVTKLAGFEYTKHVKYEVSGDLRVIKAENAGPNGFRETDYSRVSSDAVAMLSRSRLVGGELLVVFVGAGTGNVAVVPDANDFFLGPNIGMVRPTPTAALSRYLELFFRSTRGRELLLATSKAVAQPSLSMGAIRSTPVLLPPMTEQTEVVRSIETAFSWIDRLALEATSARRLIDRLDQAVLAKAFRGELVPQDPADEPACVLLERIRAERGSAPKVRRGRKARTAP